MFLLMNDKLITDVGDCELNLCYGLWCFFFFGFVTLCHSVFMILSLVLYREEREKERERERERERVEFVEITQVSQIREYLFNCFC